MTLLRLGMQGDHSIEDNTAAYSHGTPVNDPDNQMTQFR
jgi:hypothetical protein